MKVNTKSLSAALVELSPIASKRTTLPILHCVRLEATGGKLNLVASNLDIYIGLQIECDGDLGACCISCASLRDIISGDEQASFTLKDGWMHIEAAKLKCRLAVQPVEEFPAVFTVDAKPVNLDCEALAEAIVKGGYSTRKENANTAIDNVLIYSQKKATHVASYGGVRSAECLIEGSSGVEAMIPSIAATFLPDWLIRDGAVFKIGDKYGRVEVSGSYFMFRLSEATANMDQLESFLSELRIAGKAFTVNRETLIEVMQICICFLTPRTFATTLKPVKGGIEFSVESEIGAIARTIECEVSTKSATRVRPEQLVESLRKMDSESVDVCYTDNKTPIVIRDRNSMAVFSAIRMS